MELVAFLLARITEDEEAARKAVEWSTEWLTADDGVLEQVGFVGDGPDVHIARWSPARVLGECEAKRRIVRWHRLIDGLDTDDNPVLGCGNCIASGAVPPYLIAGPCLTVRLLALPYADHPDYREEWRP